jgi:2-iminoacetate synthase
MTRFDLFTERDVDRALGRSKLSEKDLAALLSPAAEYRLEEMARLVRAQTLRRFGREILLFAPLYLSSHCESRCSYCGFAAGKQVARKKLSLDEIRAEGEALHRRGYRHILLLIGCSRRETPPEYIREAVLALRDLFPVLALEVYPLEEGEYRDLYRAGAEELTVYQETYDRDLYRLHHPPGPKSDYDYRLDTPDRACRAGLKRVTVGPLLGLAPWREELYQTGLHAARLAERYPVTEIGLSLNRMRHHAGGLEPPHPVGTKALVQGLLALRLFLPGSGVSISTREEASLRDRILPLGITRLSAGSLTTVGGYAEGVSDITSGQFEVGDTRSLDSVMEAVTRAGYQPVLKTGDRWEAAP